MPGKVKIIFSRSVRVCVKVSELLFLVSDPIVDGGEVPDGAEQFASVASVFLVSFEVVNDRGQDVCLPELVLGSSFRDETLPDIETDTPNRHADRQTGTDRQDKRLLTTVVRVVSRTRP